MKKDIFVQIASYRDPQLIKTLHDLINNANKPENLKICVCWQHSPDETIEDFLDNQFDIIDQKDSTINLKYKKAKIKLLDVKHWDSQGACWARNKVQQEYDGEKYTLQLDSHHRFIKNWDSTLIEMLESLRSESPKPLLTAYIPSFDPDNDPQGRIHEPWQMDFDRFTPEGVVFFMPATIPNWKDRKAPVKARFYSAHFAFADGIFAKEVQHDPNYFFHGEEISIGVRAFTHGYDLYHPHKVVAWHEYTRKNRVKVWDDHTTPAKLKGNVKTDWVERNNATHLRNRTLFGMRGSSTTPIEFENYGFGNVRSLSDFERWSGLSFIKKAVQQQVLDKKEPETFDKNKKQLSEEDWLNSLVTSNDLRILAHKNELTHFNNEVVEDFDFWYVGSHDEHDKEVYRKDKVEAEISTMMNDKNNEWIDFRLIYLSNIKAKTFTIWPHSKSKGWLNKITKNVLDEY